MPLGSRVGTAWLARRGPHRTLGNGGRQIPTMWLGGRASMCSGRDLVAVMKRVRGQEAGGPHLTSRLTQRVLCSPVFYLHPQVFSRGHMGRGQSGHSTWAMAP